MNWNNYHKPCQCETCTVERVQIEEICTQVRRTMIGFNGMTNLEVIKALWEKLWSMRRQR